MELDLARKRVLITGASRGIGKCIAETLHNEGCQLALNARGVDALAATVASFAGAVGVVGDVSNAEEAHRVVAEAASALGGLDIVICNVGSGRSVQPGHENQEEWQRVFELNLWSATNTIEAARQVLQLSRGVIVCISSICGIEVVPGAPVTYSVAKAALNAYVRGMARPLGNYGVRINAVAPGNILFEGSVWEKKLVADSAGVQSVLESDVSLTRLGTAREVADLVAFLASPRASFATGSVWTIDGGQVRS